MRYSITYKVGDEEFVLTREGEKIFYDGFELCTRIEDATDDVREELMEEFRSLMISNPGDESYCRTKAALFFAPYIGEAEGTPNICEILDHAVIFLLNLPQGSHGDLLIKSKNGMIYSDPNKKIRFPTTGTEVLKTNYNEIFLKLVKDAEALSVEARQQMEIEIASSDREEDSSDREEDSSDREED